MGPLLESTALLLFLLNPFLLTIYLLELVRSLDTATFFRVLVRASLIAAAVFSLFAVAGDAVFSSLLQARFASFQVFGGVIFLVVAIQFVMTGSVAITALRGDPEHLAGAVAMPFMIGPGTVGASVVVGAHLSPLLAVGAVVAAVTVTAAIVLGLKVLHDRFHEGRERVVQRYVEIVGRASALVVGTFAVEMIMRGLAGWIPAIQ